ncbi:methyltransferase UbiE [Delitschia confertaspora ATCC 74209]|uniref:Methyltransferase UbiE n=1 Tax=Delitschia confertaspora ATCC 74209 TaxID=1513339 RepID=A0A9P4JHV5_9PLEO|nr:methyltransferase UbiE [Delitschia confertaspora ATCC 74209]
MALPYIHGHQDSVLRAHSWRDVSNSCGYLIQHLHPENRILDIGCGPGSITIDLAQRAPQGHVLGIDTSEEVILKARRLAEQRGILNVEFRVGNIYNVSALGLLEGSFDVVHAHQVLQHLPDPARAMREMRRLAKDGGIVAVREADYSGASWFQREPAHPGVIQMWLDLYIRVARAVGGDPNIGHKLHNIAMEAGFENGDISASNGIWNFADPDARAFWCRLWADRTRNSDFRDHTLSRSFATEDDLRLISEAWLDLANAEGGWFKMPHGEIVCKKSPKLTNEVAKEVINEVTNEDVVMNRVTNAS